MRPRTARGVSLPQPLLDAWRDAILSLARLPRGVDRRSKSPAALLSMIAKQERGAVKELWEIFTQERKDLSRSLLNARQQTVSYLLGFHLPNAARMQLLIERLAGRVPFDDFLKSIDGKLRWSDLGCGSAALTQAFIMQAAQRGFDLAKLELHLVDQSGGLLDAARLVLRTEQAPYKTFTHKMGLEKLPAERYVNGEGEIAAYALGYVWNEIDQNRAARTKLLRILTSHAERNEKALIFVLEPGNEHLCRGAMALRDELTQAGYEALYPCPHSFNCPMLAETKDWCYSEGRWHRPLAFEQLDDMIGIDRSRLAASMYVFASPALAPSLQRRDGEGGPRVIVGRPERKGARPSKQKGEDFDYLLCTAGGLTKEPALPGKTFRLRGTILRPHKD